MTSQPGKHAIAIHILTNISRSKRNEAIIFGQLAEYSMISRISIFSQNMVEELFPDPFVKDRN